MIEIERTRWRTIFILVTIGTITVAQFYKLAAALPMLRSELGLGLIAGGWLFSIVNATTATAGFAMGSVADHIGHRRAVLGALLVVVVAAGPTLPSVPSLDLWAARRIEDLGVESGEDLALLSPEDLTAPTLHEPLIEMLDRQFPRTPMSRTDSE